MLYIDNSFIRRRNGSHTFKKGITFFRIFDIGSALKLSELCKRSKNISMHLDYEEMHIMLTGNIIQTEVDKIRLATGKQLLTLEEAAKYVGIDTNDFAEIINSGDKPIRLLGKGYIRIADLAGFLYGDVGVNEVEKIVEKPLDSGFPQRYPPSKIEDLSEEGYIEMERRGKGEGSIFYNESRKVWQAAVSLGYDENGKRRRKIVSGESKEEVEEALQLLLAAYSTIAGEQTAASETALTVNEKALAKAKETTFKEVLNNTLKNIQGGPRTRTFANYIGTAKLIEQGIGHIMMSELTKDDLQRFLNEFSSKKYTKGSTVSYYSQSAIHKVYLLLNTTVREAVDKELIRRPFALKEPKSKKHVESKYKALQDNEIKAILDAVEDNPMLKAAIMIMTYTGMRPGEVFALRFQDIDYQNRTISVEQALSLDWEEPDIETKTYTNSRTPIIKNLKNDDGGKSAYACRTLKISEKVLDTIKDWQKYLETKPVLLEKRKKNGLQDFLFTGVHGHLALLEHYHQVYERQLAKKGLSSKVYNFYRFRHNFCTRNLKAKKDPKTVARLMGDNTLDMVLRVYNSINKDDVIKASDEYSIEMDATLEDVI